MRCPDCEASGIPSRVKEHPKFVRVRSRPVSFYDESGEFHNHDLGSIATPFECSEGHRWEHHSKTLCPTCRIVVDPISTDRFGRPA